MEPTGWMLFCAIGPDIDAQIFEVVTESLQTLQRRLMIRPCGSCSLHVGQIVEVNQIFL